MVPMRLGCCCAAVVTEAAAAAALVPPAEAAGPSSLVPCAAWVASASFVAVSDDKSAPPDVPRRAADAILPNMMVEAD